MVELVGSWFLNIGMERISVIYIIRTDVDYFAVCFFLSSGISKILSITIARSKGMASCPWNGARAEMFFVYIKLYKLI